MALVVSRRRDRPLREARERLVGCPLGSRSATACIEGAFQNDSRNLDARRRIVMVCRLFVMMRYHVASDMIASKASTVRPTPSLWAMKLAKVTPCTGSMDGQRSKVKLIGTITHAATAWSPCRAGTKRQRLTVSSAVVSRLVDPLDSLSSTFSARPPAVT